MQSSKSTRAHGALCQCFVEVCRFIAVLSLDGERFPRPAVAALWDEREGVFVERAAGEVGRFGERSARCGTGSTPPPTRSAIAQAWLQNGGRRSIASSSVVARTANRMIGRWSIAAASTAAYP